MRLASLGAFQLYKCDVVLTILTSLLSSADSQISTPALSAIFRYKLPHVKPYVEILGALVSVENFRESMTKFDWRSVPTEHADELVKILTRIMFGKLKANNTKGTSKVSDESREMATEGYIHY